MTLLVPVLVASLAGSLHCVGMCGGLVAFASGGDRRATVVYHLARLLAYAGLGAAAGTAGAVIELAADPLGVSRIAAVIAGGGVLLWGAWSLARTVKPGAAHQPSRLMRVLPRLVSGRGPWVRAAVLGSITAALPCGWLYAFVALAAGTGAPWEGAAVLTAFGLGTLPALSAVGVLTRWARVRLGARAPAFFAVLLMATGLWTLTMRGQLDLEPTVSATAQLPTPDEAPCCHVP